MTVAAAVQTERASRVLLPDGRTVETVEHALAAATARGWFRDLTLEVDGPELPLADGSAAAWCTALAALGAPTAGPGMAVTAPWEGALDGTVMRLDPGPCAVVVWTDFTAHGLPAERVRWDGRWETFVADIGPARTFGFVSEAEAMLAAGRARGLAAGLDPGTVMVFDPHGRPDPRFAAPVDRGEVARHKLLDAVGDLGLVGARIQGTVTLARPGHARTLGLLREALRVGALRAQG